MLYSTKAKTHKPQIITAYAIIGVDYKNIFNKQDTPWFSMGYQTSQLLIQVIGQVQPLLRYSLHV